MKKNSKKILVLGCGSIGRRHIANLQSLGYRPVAFDPDLARREWVKKNLNCETVAAVAEGLKQKPRAAWICTPPHLHAASAAAALERGIACFIEKPLAHTQADAAAILRLSRQNRTPVTVGYQLRCHPALLHIKSEIEHRRWGRLLFVRAELGQYLPDWRPWQDYRKSYTARKSMGGGILLDASHEIDLVRWLAGEIDSVFCSAATLSDLKINVEDTAALILNFKSGVMGEVHLDMVQRAYRRSLQVVFEKATLLWDLPTAELRTYKASSKRWTTKSYLAELNFLYLAEARAFLKHLDKPSSNGVISPEDGAQTMAAIAAAQRSIKSQRLEKVR